MQPILILIRALSTEPSRLVAAPLLQSVIEVRRKSRKRPPDIRFAVSDQMAMECRKGSDPDRRPLYLLIGIPRKLVEKIEKGESRIVKLGDDLVKTAGGVVVP